MQYCHYSRRLARDLLQCTIPKHKNFKSSGQPSLAQVCVIVFFWILIRYNMYGWDFWSHDWFLLASCWSILSICRYVDIYVDIFTYAYSITGSQVHGNMLLACALGAVRTCRLTLGGRETRRRVWGWGSCSILTDHNDPATSSWPSLCLWLDSVLISATGFIASCIAHSFLLRHIPGGGAVTVVHSLCI